MKNKNFFRFTEREKKKVKNIAACIMSMILVLSFPLFVIGYTSYDYNSAIIAINLVFLAGIIFSYINVRRRIVYLIFNICMWVFLISRPTISMLRGNEWWYFDAPNVKFALIALYTTLISIMAGARVCEYIMQKKGMLEGEHTPRFFVRGERDIALDKSIQIISGALFLVCFVCKMAVGLEKVAFMSGKEYYEYYVSYESSFPYFFNSIAAMLPYALCMFLAAMPKKRYSYAILIMYVATTLPNLLVGIRNDIVLALIFSFLYFFVRDYFDGTKRWIGKVERLACVIAIPVALIFLGAYNYIRDAAEYESDALYLVVDLFYKQGVSFDVLCIGYAAIPNLPAVVAKNYTFGNAIDYLKTNVVARKLLGTEAFSGGNSEQRAIYGNDFSHSMSYVARDDYLDGHGYGSSFILETFADYGYIGMIIFSILLGMLMIYMLYLLRKSRMMRVVILTVLTQFFFTPRGAATGAFTFLVYVQYWVPVIVILICAYLINKKYSIIKFDRNYSKSVVKERDSYV